MVAKGILAIKSKDFRKLVLSRTKVVPLPEDFNIVRTYEAISRKYPKAFSYLFSIPQVGTWMGATPEILVTKTQDNMLHTVALGGTQVMTPENLNHPVWGKKDSTNRLLSAGILLTASQRLVQRSS